MNPAESRLVLETIECLMAIDESEAPPSEANRRLNQVVQLHPHIKLDLLWDNGGGDDFGRHYDALVRLPQGGTLSLSYCGDRALPWPLRGARRFGEADLLRVNDTVVTVGQAIGQIDAMLADRSVSTRLIDACLVSAELERNPVEVTDTDLQRTMDAFRRTHRLYTVESCRRWMERRGLSQTQFERLIADRAMVRQLRQRLTAEGVASFFAAQGSAFDTAHFVQTTYQDRASAERARSDIDSGLNGFFDEAQRRYIAESTTGSTPRTGFRSLERGLDPSPLVQAVFAATPGYLLGPLEVDGNFLLVHVLSTESASLTEALRERIQHLLFDRWLDDRRKLAQIEWFWHDVH